ncbi:MAG TPA: hypothetical protein VHD95_16540 [Rhizomicrobium sp.]|nr:hypothetical protein [Rhizomicrobium sp.]
MEHEQFEILIAALLAAGQMNRPQASDAKPIEILAKTLEDLRAAQIIVKRSANFIPKGGR